uniref:Uncharacterized protein n=1 Tax=Oryza barthii TaxID=65489 RepID=A0A0D3FWA0_9ORYZ
MSALAVGDADGGVVSPGGGLQASPTVVVDGDVVLSGVVLVLVALAFVFVMHHFLAAMRRRDSEAGSSSASSGRQRGGRGVMAGVVGIDAAKAGGQGGVDPAVLRALPGDGAQGGGGAAAAAAGVRGRGGDHHHQRRRRRRLVVRRRRSSSSGAGRRRGPGHDDDEAAGRLGEGGRVAKEDVEQRGSSSYVTLLAVAADDNPE